MCIYKLSHDISIKNYHDARQYFIRSYIYRRAEKVKTQAGHRLYANFTPVTKGRSMKDACGCLVLESFNTTRGVMVGRETTRSESKRQSSQARGIARKRERRNKREESKREKTREREYFEWLVLSEMREMRSVMGRNRLYSNGVAIRVMLEYIDYWGDQRVGDDGMTPLLNSRKEDEGSKQLVLYSATRSPHFRSPHSRFPLRLRELPQISVNLSCRFSQFHLSCHVTSYNSSWNREVQ